MKYHIYPSEEKPSPDFKKLAAGNGNKKVRKQKIKKQKVLVKKRKKVGIKGGGKEKAQELREN